MLPTVRQIIMLAGTSPAHLIRFALGNARVTRFWFVGHALYLLAGDFDKLLERPL